MKKVSFLLLALTSLSISFAQNMKMSGANFKYKDIPASIRDKDENTYSVDIRSSADLSSLGTSAEALENFVNFNTLTKLEGFADIKIDMRILSYGYLNPELKSITSNGVITGYNYYCEYAIPYTYTVVSKNINFNNNGSTEATKGNVEVYKGKTFVTSAEAQADWNKTGWGNLRAQVRKSIEAKVSKLTNDLSSNMEFIDRDWSLTFFYFKSTGKEDFMAYETASEESATAAKTITPNMVRAELAPKFENHIKFWKANLLTLDPNDKKLDKLFFANAYNIALAYYLLDDMENASLQAKEMERVDQNELVEKQLLNNIASRSKGLQACKNKGVNPYVGSENASPEKVETLRAKYEKERVRLEQEKQIEIEKALALEKMRTAPVINEYEGYIIDRKSVRSEGTFKEYKQNTGDKENYTYFIVKGTTKEILLSSANMLECHFDDRSYENVKYFSGSDGYENEMMYIIFNSPKISVYKGGNGFIYYLKPGEKTATNTNSLLWGSAFKKSTAVFFSDCAELVKKIDAGDYPASSEMRIALAKDYSDICK